MRRPHLVGRDLNDLDAWLDGQEASTDEEQAAAGDLEQAVLAAFDVGGPLARLDVNYQPREQQLAMSRAVAQAIERARGPGGGEAGTGVGKTLPTWCRPCCRQPRPRQHRHQEPAGPALPARPAAPRGGPGRAAAPRPAQRPQQLPLPAPHEGRLARAPCSRTGARRCSLRASSAGLRGRTVATLPRWTASTTARPSSPSSAAPAKLSGQRVPRLAQLLRRQGAARSDGGGRGGRQPPPLLCRHCAARQPGGRAAAQRGYRDL